MKFFLTGITILILWFAKPEKLMAQMFEEGDNVAGFGFGFGSTYIGYNYNSLSPAIVFSFEHCTWAHNVGPGSIGLGASLGFRGASYHAEPVLGYYYDYKWRYTILEFRGAYHYNVFKEPKLDTYAGISLGLDFVSFSRSGNYYNLYPYTATDTYNSGFFPGLFFGGRYYLSSRFALYSEIGFGAAFFALGANYKF